MWRRESAQRSSSCCLQAGVAAGLVPMRGWRRSGHASWSDDAGACAAAVGGLALAVAAAVAGVCRLLASICDEGFDAQWWVEEAAEPCRCRGPGPHANSNHHLSGPVATNNPWLLLLLATPAVTAAANTKKYMRNRAMLATRAMAVRLRVV